jgi:ATP-dependent helicase/nuclease subunit B
MRRWNGSEMAPGDLNILTSALRDYFREHVLEEKVLLAPSRRVGFQWLDAVARSGSPVVSARVETLTGIALSLAAPEMDRLGLRLIGGVRLEFAVDNIASGLIGSRGGAYLSGIAPSPGLTRTLTAAIRDLRLAGVTSRSIKPAAFEVEEKGLEVKQMLAEFEKLLSETGQADYAQTLSMAARRLADEPGSPGDAVYLMPEDMIEDLRGLERVLWDAVPEGRGALLPVDKPGEAPPGADTQPMTDSMLLRWTVDPDAAPAPSGDGTASIRSAVGEANEAREVLRRCIEGSVPFDHVEVVHTDPSAYVPLFYELATRVVPEGSDDLPVTFAEGIPARYSRPGRALVAWLDWTREGFPQRELVRIVRDGLLEVPGLGESGLSFARLAAILRELPVGVGLERYMPKVRSALEALDARLRELEAEPPAESDGDEGERALTVQKRERLSSRREGLGLLATLLGALEAHAPVQDDSPEEALSKGRWFLEQQARSMTKIDAYGREALVDRVGELQDCIAEGGPARFDALAWLADLPESVRILGQGPKPGCIHVSSIYGGGHSGRPHTFILGMDDTRFPGAGLQDPVLLDRERTALSAVLPTAGARIKSKVTGFARLAARLRGEVVLSYCSRSLSDDREMFPSRLLVAANRTLTGGPTALLRPASPPGSFAPLDEAGCLDMTEWWLWRTCSAGAVEAPERVMGENFSNLARGFEALAARAGDEFTEYDGFVPEAGPACDCTAPDGPVVSASRLELLASCPLEYFFRYVLKIEPPEEFDIDPRRWLDPLERGSLLHAVFCDFTREMQASGERRPMFERDRARLLEILDHFVEDKKVDKPPPPDPGVFLQAYQELRATAETFLAMEERFCEGHSTTACELAVGLLPDGAGTGFDLEEAGFLRLPDGRAVRVRCRLDRVDRIGDSDHYVVRDFKTGKSDKYQKHGPFHGGRFMQGAVYPALGQAALRARLGDAATVVRFEYVFPRPSEARILAWPVEALADGMAKLALLCDMISKGSFPMTTDASDVEYSDYREAYVDVAGAVADITRKVTSPANEMLEPYRLLREITLEAPEGEGEACDE